MFIPQLVFAARGKHVGGYMYSYYVPPTSSTPWRPAWSPDGRQIAFSMAGSIWKIRVGETVAYELTANPGYDSSPVWSPDGRWIVYTTEAISGGTNLMLLNVATGESTPLTKGDDLHLEPVWSPDGSRIAFVLNQPRSRFHVYAMPLENGKPGAPVRITEENSFGRPRLYFDAYDDHISPSFSPDGKEMLLVSNRGITLGSGAIWRAPVEPDAMAKAQQLLREETLYRTQPQWSPDGKRILYSSHRGSQFNNLYVLPVAGGEPYQLTFGEWDHFDPRWSPDGEWIAYISNEKGISDLRLLKTFGGEERKIEIQRRVYRRPMGTVEVHVRDSSKGSLTPARMYLTGSDGKAYGPADAFLRIAPRATKEDFFHTTGRFVVDVPEGAVMIEAVKGFEYKPVSKNVTASSGKVTLVEMSMDRLTDLSALGWYSGSDHVHMNYGGNMRNTPENMLFMAQAEDLDVVGEKIANKDNRILDHQYFTGTPHALSSEDRILRFDEEYRPPFYGHINFLNLTKHLISPFTTGYEGTAIERLYPSNTDMFRLASEQGAIGGYVHPWSADPETTGRGVARGFPVDLALGTIAYLEVLTSAEHYTHTSQVWHRALNCGFRLTASAGEDSITDSPAMPILGADRLYAYLGPELRWDGWVDAIRRGQTFVTNGPLLQFEVNGEIPGAEIRLPAAGGTVEVNGRLQSIVPVKSLEVIFNGRVIESLPLDSGGTTAQFRKRISIPKSGWLTLKAAGTSVRRPVDDAYPVAETSPVYVYCGEQPIRSREDAEYFIRGIDDITKQANEHTGWRSERERAHVLAQFAEARRIFEQRATE